jgi:hypothetical protein
MAKTANWFEVDKVGLSKLIEKRGKEFIIHELVQNSWDTAAKKVEVFLGVSGVHGLADLKVMDDHPEGWKDLTHAWTLFAESEKKANPEKRGRFNLGEKLVLALCKEATIETTTGGVRFDSAGRHTLRSKSPSGSVFSASLKMNRNEVDEVGKAVQKLLPPPGCETIYNGERISYRTPIKEIEATLPTEISDADGVLRRSARKTMIQVVEVRPGEVATIYEMGIPVVETSDKWHYNILQKVPLNSDRDNVTPSYLQEVRTVVLNTLYDRVTPDDSTEDWVRDGLGDKNVEGDAVQHVITARYGDKRVTTDPHDHEANNIAVLQGYNVIPPRAFSKEEWANIKKHGAAKPAGQVTPSPRIQIALNGGEDIKLVTQDKWSDAMKTVVAYTKDLAQELLGHTISIRIASKVTWPYAAWYGSSELTFNLGRLGHSFFNEGPGERVDRLLLHEFGHDTVSNHLSEDFHDVLCVLGSKLAALVSRKPEIFKKHGWKA